MSHIIKFKSKAVKAADKERILSLFQQGLIDLYERDKWLKLGRHV